MASRLKWLVVVLAGCVIVTLWVRSSISEMRDVNVARVAREEEEGATRSLRAADAAYRQHIRADSLLPLLPREPGIAVLLAPELSAEQEDSVRAVLQRQLTRTGAPRVRIGVFMIDHRAGKREGVPAWGPQREIYAGSDSLGPYCAAVEVYVPLSGRGRVAPVFNMEADGSVRHRSADVLRQCALHARYGAPGDRIAGWLEEGGYRMAGHRDHIQTELPPRALQRSSSPFERRLIGCSGGRMDLCDALIDFEIPLALRGGVRHPLRRAAHSTSSGIFYMEGPLGDMLYEIEREFGEARFQRFWSSSADVRTAFEEAFGLSFGVWVREWGQARFGAYTPGPHVASGGIIGTLLAVSLFLAAALGVAHRRRLS